MDGHMRNNAKAATEAALAGLVRRQFTMEQARYFIQEDLNAKYSKWRWQVTISSLRSHGPYEVSVSAI